MLVPNTPCPVHAIRHHNQITALKVLHMDWYCLSAVPIMLTDEGCITLLVADLRPKSDSQPSKSPLNGKGKTSDYLTFTYYVLKDTVHTLNLAKETY
ncbi:hypothetical protein E2C01_007425 [Portunus trituberculatus]|uniref:Uncharacterized protein n=1 Tax=Portunus trituberculatus TaxID=210409 RepID=A0A5B7D147_PORTR|nr:hypothetical protein [Portunus trituberculatus]